ncbi:MAG TPA: hypothetical protein VLM05_18600, partial [Mycobacteriales bacterium]|nr:hypothetical protein [Mycobacteriales bacterium]
MTHSVHRPSRRRVAVLGVLAVAAGLSALGWSDHQERTPAADSTPAATTPAVTATSGPPPTAGAAAAAPVPSLGTAIPTTPSRSGTPTPTPSPTRRPAGPTGCAASPSACGYPDGSNTGVPNGVALRPSKSVDADKNGQVIDGLDVTGEINVVASNVTIRNTRVTGGGDWVVVVRPGAANLRIEDSELQTPAGSPQDIACVLNIGDTRPTILRTDIHGCSAGV